MKAFFKHFDPKNEYKSPEGCFINETSNDEGDGNVSITRARVEPGVSTEIHMLIDTAERYLIISGKGSVELDYNDPVEVKVGDVIRIPPGIPQQITNTGEEDLIFYCICTPRFQEKNYVSLK